MAQADAAKAQWIERVLGVELPATTSQTAAPDPAARWRDAVQVWRAASDTADTQIGKLRTAMLATGHDQLQEIARSHLGEVIGDKTEALREAVSEIGGGEDGKLAKGRAQAMGALRAFRNHLARDIRVAACDDNEFGIAVSLRTTLDPALAAMEAALRG